MTMPNQPSAPAAAPAAAPERFHALTPGCGELLRQLREHGMPPLASGKIHFAGVGECDVYNITAPFFFDGRVLIAGRVEARATEHSTLTFFERGPDGSWYPCAGAPTYPGLQDPCVTLIGGELVVGGVRFPITLRDGRCGWQMEFYRGRALRALEGFLVGPEAMKDIRLGGLPDGRVVVFSRPQGARGGRGKIGVAVVGGLDELSARVIEDAPLLEGQFPESEWGGANEVHPLRGGVVGVLGHTARFDEHGGRHYYAMTFTVDPFTLRRSPIRVFAERSQFPAGPAKRPDLADVIFTGGLVRHGDGTATLYTGLSDAEAGYVRVLDPMAAYER